MKNSLLSTEASDETAHLVKECKGIMHTYLSAWKLTKGTVL